MLVASTWKLKSLSRVSSIAYSFPVNMNIKSSLQLFKIPRKSEKSQGTMKVEAGASIVSSSFTNVWTFEDKQRLICILTQRKGKAGDGFNFTVAVWNQIAEELNKYHTKGILKTARTCMSKWGQVHDIVN